MENEKTTQSPKEALAPAAIPAESEDTDCTPFAESGATAGDSAVSNGADSAGEAQENICSDGNAEKGEESPLAKLEARLCALETLLSPAPREEEADDMAVLHRLYPETAGIETSAALPNADRYASFRQKGLTPREAFIAACPDFVIAGAVRAARRQEAEAKSHLTSAVPKERGEAPVVLSGGTLSQWRALFPDKSDKEIIRLYKETL